ncbi:MAG: hypothetical protein IPM34_12405 [Saprospiraceae bacterium]|nr:hypothetical protein [Saprospiraceae bacterium]
MIRTRNLWLLCIPFFLFTQSVFSLPRDTFIFDSGVREIYNSILNLDLDAAGNQLSEIRKKTGKRLNKAYLLLENELDFYNIFLLDKKAIFEKSKSNRDIRIKELDKSKLSDRWKSFIKSEIDLQWALIHLKQQNMLKGIQLLYGAKKLLDEKIEEYPDFYQYKKSWGILQALLGTIPPEYQWASRLAGLDGNIKQGREALQLFVLKSEKQGGFLIEEAYAAYCFILCYLEHKPKEAFQYWIGKSMHPNPGPLQVWVQAKVALRAGLNEAARMALRSAPESHFEKLPHLYYLRGLAELQALQNQSDKYFEKFIKSNQGHNYIKEAWQKRAWNALLKGQPTLYKLHISQCLTQGANQLDEDQQAYQDAKSGVLPDTLLLKARLLCDGAYTEKARNLLEAGKADFNSNPLHLLEYHYRMARIYHIEKNYNKALEFYQQVMASGQHQNYWHCNAALQSGLILEELRKDEEAARYFETVLKLKPDRYRNSMQQKAKAGLSRLATK